MAKTIAGINVILPEESQAFQAFIKQQGVAATEDNAAALCNHVYDKLNHDKLTPEGLAQAYQDLAHVIVSASVYNDYRAAAKLFNADQLYSFEQWYSGQKLVSDGDYGLENRTQILRRLRGQQVSNQTCQTALDQIMGNNKTWTKKLHWKAVESAKPEQGFGRHSGKKFDGNSGWNENIHLPELDGHDDRFSKRTPSKHASNPALATRPTAAQTNESFRGRADKAAQGDTPAESAELRKIFVTQNGLRINALTSDVSWERTYIAREEAYKAMRRNKETGR